jgi:hypothetical protein
VHSSSYSDGEQLCIGYFVGTFSFGPLVFITVLVAESYRRKCVNLGDVIGKDAGLESVG